MRLPSSSSLLLASLAVSTSTSSLSALAAPASPQKRPVSGGVPPSGDGSTTHSHDHMQARSLASLCKDLDLPGPLSLLCSLLPLEEASAEAVPDSLKEVREEPISKVALRGEAEHPEKADSPPTIARAVPREPQLPPSVPGAGVLGMLPVPDATKLLGNNI